MVISFIGMSSAGKSVIGNQLYQKIKQRYQNTVFIDGDMVRPIIGPDLGYTLEDRRESEARRSKLCKLLSDQGIHVICAALSNYPEWRQWCADNIGNYFEIYLKVPIEILHNRDRKGIYKQAVCGKIKHVVGFDIEFHPPTNPDLVIENTGQTSVEEIVNIIIENLPVIDSTERNGYLFNAKR